MTTETNPEAGPGVKTEVTEVGPCRLEIKIEIPPADVAAKLEDKFRNLGNNIAMPGFRKGKVPRKMLEKRYGKEVADEAKADLMREAYEKAVKDRNLAILGEPEVDPDKVTMNPEQPLAFQIQVEVRPLIKLGEYKGLAAKKRVVPLTDVDVDAGLMEIRQRQAELVPVEGGQAEKGDVAICDEEFLVAGEPPIKHENVEIVLDGESLTVLEQRQSALAASLIGASVGQFREADIDVPPTFREAQYAGKKGKFRITIQDLKRSRLPEANDEWAKSLDFENLAHMRDEVKKRLAAVREEAAVEAMQDELVDQLLAAHEFPLPEGMLAKMQREILSRKHMELEMAGMPHDKVHALMEQMGDMAKEAVTRMLKSQLILDEIAKRERVFVTQPEIEARIEEIARRNKKWPHEVKEHFESHGMMPSLRAEMRERKVRRLLLAQAKVTDSAPQA